MGEDSFKGHKEGLQKAVELLLSQAAVDTSPTLPEALPESGLGGIQTIEILAPVVIGGARHLGADLTFAHMDPPTPWVSWAVTLWNAALNQNLLHPDVSPMARRIEALVIDWLAPFFGMRGGHMTPGSTVANLTALWAAREIAGVERVIASQAAHVSIAKAAHLLNLDYESIGTDVEGRIDLDRLPADLQKSALILTAGTTSAGAIDPLDVSHLRSGNGLAWVHVDAAWAGPLRLSTTHAHRLDGIGSADSVAVSAHKWLYQPKESGLVFFRDVDAAHRAVSFGADYLEIPNVGLLGSHGAQAVVLLATLLSLGRSGIAALLDRAMRHTDQLRGFLEGQSSVSLYASNMSGVTLWRMASDETTRQMAERLPAGSASQTRAAGYHWIRHVAANPNVSIARLCERIAAALNGA